MPGGWHHMGQRRRAAPVIDGLRRGRAMVHPLGGAVLGRACVSCGRVLSYKNLYVVNGAHIPGAAGCANPSFTVAALAECGVDALVPEVIDGRSTVLAAS